MNGKEVNELQRPENQIEQDQGKSQQYLIAKLHLFNVAYHNIECGYIRDWDKEQYGFIPFPVGSFADMLIEASVYFKMDKSKKFLDIGCGPGTKLLMAKLFFDVQGIEIIDHFIEQARSLDLQDRIQKADATEYEHYGDFDVLYFYRPFKDHDLQKQFESRLYNQMRPGTLLSPMHTVTNWSDLPNMERLSRYLYLKNDQGGPP